MDIYIKSPTLGISWNSTALLHSHLCCIHYTQTAIHGVYRNGFHSPVWRNYHTNFRSPKNPFIPQMPALLCLSAVTRCLSSHICSDSWQLTRFIVSLRIAFIFDSPTPPHTPLRLLWLIISKITALFASALCGSR